MTCKEVRIQLANHFDQDNWSNLSKAILDHISRCKDCQQYYQMLNQLGQGIDQLNTNHHSMSSAVVWQRLAEVVQENRLPYHRKVLRWRRIALSVAAALFITVGTIFFLRQKNFPPSGESELYVQFSDSQPGTTTIVFQSDSSGEPIIIWMK